MSMLKAKCCNRNISECLHWRMNVMNNCFIRTEGQESFTMAMLAVVKQLHDGFCDGIAECHH